MMSPPLITIGITCHNAADTIGRAIKSALAQDWPSFEVLVVDDCSNDESAALVAEAIAEEPRARLIRHERNAGVAVARNTVVENARGAFIAFFDDDDESVPGRLLAQWERLVAYERIAKTQFVFCYSNRRVVGQGSQAVGPLGLAIGRHAPEPHGPAVADYVLKVSAAPGFVWGQLGSCTLMARRGSFAAVGPFDERFRRCAEWDMAVRGGLIGAHFIGVDRPLITQHVTESAEKAGSAPLKYLLLLHEKHRGYLRSRGAYLGSRALTRASFYRFQGRSWRSHAYRMVAMLVSPALLLDRIRSRTLAWTSGRNF